MKKRLILSLISFVLLVGVIILLLTIWVNHKSDRDEQTNTGLNTEEATSENSNDVELDNSYEETAIPNSQNIEAVFNYSDVKDYSGAAVQVINDNIPYFDQEEKQNNISFERYSDLDDLGRCGEAYACVGIDTLPTEERGSIGSVKPSGWQTVKYDFIDGKYLYNRCHLIGYQISGENSLETNLITGTRYLNVEGMLPYENQVSEYVKATKNHVLYRVTPYFQESNLVANGVLMEAWSVEDGGTGICFCVFAYNVQPGVTIDYRTGDSKQNDSFIVLEDSDETVEADRFIEETGELSDENTEVTYIGNKNSHRFHYPNCEGVEDMKDENKVYFYGDRNEPIEAGYVPCGSCNP